VAVSHSEPPFFSSLTRKAILTPTVNGSATVFGGEIETTGPMVDLMTLETDEYERINNSKNIVSNVHFPQLLVNQKSNKQTNVDRCCIFTHALR
jgi:hypothetical protein